MEKLQRSERLAFKAIGNETIILDTKIGKEVHQLNEVASFVWNLCDGQHELKSIVSKVCEEFDVEELEAAADIESLIAGFKTKSLLSSMNEH